MLIKVRVSPGAKVERILKKTEDSFDVKIKEKAQAGRANERIKIVLEQHFNAPVRLIKGARQKNKIFEVIFR